MSMNGVAARSLVLSDLFGGKTWCPAWRQTKLYIHIHSCIRTYFDRLFRWIRKRHFGEICPHRAQLSFMSWFTPSLSVVVILRVALVLNNRDNHTVVCPRLTIRPLVPLHHHRIACHFTWRPCFMKRLIIMQRMPSFTSTCCMAVPRKKKNHCPSWMPPQPQQTCLAWR